MTKSNAVWEKAKKVDGKDPNKFRQDPAGAWIQKDRYAKEEPFGWGVDHMFPESLGGTDHTDNLQALQWENNRSKADNFPKFTTVASSVGDNYVKEQKHLEFTASFIATLKRLYPNNPTVNKL